MEVLATLARIRDEGILHLPLSKWQQIAHLWGQPSPRNIQRNAKTQNPISRKRPGLMSESYDELTYEDHYVWKQTNSEFFLIVLSCFF